jgi:hypothetical protein
MPERISVEDARRKLTSPGSTTLLVCAYEDESKCAQRQLEGAISLKQLQARQAAVSPDQELIFYCA